MAATPGRLPATSSAPRAPHQLFEFKQQVTGSGPPEQVWTRGIVVGDWTVRVTHGSIANAGDIDALTDKLGIPPPEMPFLHNSLILEHAPSGFSYCFDAARALQCVDGVRTEQQLTPIQYSGTPTADPPVRPKRSLSRSGIQVAYAKEWGQSRYAAPLTSDARHSPPRATFLRSSLRRSSTTGPIRAHGLACPALKRRTSTIGACR